jgi:uncharacterized membrane protein YjjP (DUF1212 family)
VDFYALLNFATEVGYQLQMSGAEIYRVEESVQRLLAAYGAPTGEVFAIPNCLNVSVAGPETGKPLTRIRRVGPHGTDISRLEALNQLCRDLEANPVPLEEAEARFQAILSEKVEYSFLARLGAYALGASAFALFFKGDLRDAFCGMICGIIVGLSLHYTEQHKANSFFKVFIGGFLSALAALLLVACGIGSNADSIIIGALMALVPGIALTTAVRDIIAGDMISGLSKTAESILIAIFIALGTGLAIWAARILGVSL